MTGLVRTDMQLDLDRLRDWFEALRYYEYPTKKDDTIDYAKDYFEPGSRGYGWALHVFEEPENTESVWWRTPSRKDDPMIRSKGKITFKDGTKCHIGNEHFTKRREACNGYMAEVMNLFPEAYRATVWAMCQGFKFVEHIDYPQEQTYRMHVVLYTNPEAMFKLGDEVVHMPADGHIWMVRTGSEMHTAWNNGPTDRIHVHWQMPIETWDIYLESMVSP